MDVLRKSSLGIEAPSGKAVPPPPEAVVEIAGSTDEARLNKTEKAYLIYLRGLEGLIWIGVQNVTLKLGDDCRYTPDFVTVDANRCLAMREVKGFFREDAKVKIKVAARMFPWLPFYLVRKTKNGWEHERIKP